MTCALTVFLVNVLE